MLAGSGRRSVSMESWVLSPNPFPRFPPLTTARFPAWTARVVNVLPNQVEEMTVRVRNESTGQDEWIWYFVLEVEGPNGSTMRLIIIAEDAVCLLSRCGAVFVRTSWSSFPQSEAFCLFVCLLVCICFSHLLPSLAPLIICLRPPLRRQVVFLNGSQPGDLSVDVAARKRAHQVRHRLLANGGAYLKFCCYCYPDNWGLRRWRLFDTALVD